MCQEEYGKPAHRRKSLHRGTKGSPAWRRRVSLLRAHLSAPELIYRRPVGASGSWRSIPGEAIEVSIVGVQGSRSCLAHRDDQHAVAKVHAGRSEQFQRSQDRPMPIDVKARDAYQPSKCGRCLWTG